MSTMSPCHHSRGVALVTVMFVMTLITTLLVYLVEAEHLAIRRVSNQQESEQGFHIAVYAEQWARKTLESDIRRNETDHLGEDWKTKAPTLTGFDRAVVETDVTDLQGRFNVNNLAPGRDDVWYPVFQRLLSVLELDPGLADAVLDWVDEDLDVSGRRGAEDAEYLLKEPPYRTANRPAVTVGELRWVQGMSPEALAALWPHIAALPDTDVAINVNTASRALIRSLTPDILGAGQAGALMAGRRPDGYTDINDFLGRRELAGQGDSVEGLIAVRSQYFQVHSRVAHGRHGTGLHSVIERPAETRQARVIQRRRGLW